MLFNIEITATHWSMYYYRFCGHRKVKRFHLEQLLQIQLLKRWGELFIVRVEVTTSLLDILVQICFRFPKRPRPSPSYFEKSSKVPQHPGPPFSLSSKWLKRKRKKQTTAGESAGNQINVKNNRCSKLLQLGLEARNESRQFRSFVSIITPSICCCCNYSSWGRRRSRRIIY